MEEASFGQKLMTVEDLCGYLGVSKDYIYDEVRKRRLKATRLARQLRFRPADVDAYVEAQRCQLQLTGEPRLIAPSDDSGQTPTPTARRVQRTSECARASCFARGLPQMP